MEKPIVQDMVFLAIPSQEATEQDVPLAQDLLDTLEANRARCVGLAANMIGVSKRVIAFDDQGKSMAMLNPVILEKSGAYEAEEGCLSLSGVRKTVRYEKIKVAYQNMKMQKKTRTFHGFTAQIIQHEVDHCDGILI
ncbi:MAG: peptide deformylase [Clostridiales bacterium]|nr:peptide deformylase [Clostridiales bacterium]